MSNITMFQSFPPACQDGDMGDLCRGMSGAVDEILGKWADWWDDYRKNLIDPMTIAPDLLDFVGSLPSSPWRSVGWNPGWPEASKRQLLLWSAEIFQDRYTPAALARLFQCFNSEAQIEYLSGWILGGVGVGSPLGLTCILGAGLTSYRIRVPSYYKVGTSDRAIVDWCVTNFGLPIAVDYVVF